MRRGGGGADPEVEDGRIRARWAAEGCGVGVGEAQDEPSPPACWQTRVVPPIERKYA